VDTFQFVAAMTGSLVWPATIGGLLIAYRRPITERISKLHHLKYKEFEAFFGREVKEMKVEIGEPLSVSGVAKLRQAPQTIDGRGAVSALTLPASTSEPTLNDAERLIDKGLSEAAIFSTWATVEAEMRTFLRAHGLASQASPQVSTREQISALAQSALADNRTVDVLRRMHNLFEILSHESSHLTSREIDDNAREYVALARSVIERLHRLDGRES